ncbi:CHRD domain-containing protein [Hyalangium gracile]|uniref:CHRD domain-containing protein n=1 Tax=Hyalangium gracile TaxID=394092 RepID=UPI001CCCCA8B|nr:CHRD domain-containing protein [Hyalangium gracile]
MKANRLFIACVAALSLAACGGATEYTAALTGGAQKPTAVSTPASGTVTVKVSDKLEVEGNFKDLTSNTAGAHIHGPINATGEGDIFCNLMVPTGTTGDISAGSGAGSCGDKELTDEQQKFFEDGKMYVNIHTTTYGGGEIRGDLKKAD